MSIAKRINCEATVRDRWVTSRLVEETGMPPDELAQVIRGYFDEVLERAEPPAQDVQADLFGD